MNVDFKKIPFDNVLEELEWLETNGLGGWSGSTITGCNTRRYHGLLIAATNPPTERMGLVSKLDETIILGEERFDLGTNKYGDVIHPKGFQYLHSFSKEFFPQWIYELKGTRLKKTIGMIYGENTTIIFYDVLNSDRPFKMELLPLVSARSYHSLQHAQNNICAKVNFENGIFSTQPHHDSPVIFISVPGATFRHQPSWYYNFNYAVELYRGQDFKEDLFNHGRFTVELKEGDSLGIIISTEDPTNRNALELIDKEISRRKSLTRFEPEDETLRQLILAADQFIVRRNIPTEKKSHSSNKEGATIIAGYHWFTDWGRDTMISLPGLCLVTGRHDDAKKILAAFANSVSMGMVPNRFQDNGKGPEYNTVDGTLWFFIAVYKYFLATGDTDFILQEMLPVLKNIIEWHCKGTRYNIHETEDALLFSGEVGVQLTWMDAKTGDWVVTPRIGKPVEVNALWYNTLCIYEQLLRLNNEQEESKKFREKAILTNKNFNLKFWNNNLGCLYDVVDEDVKDETIRPNQLFAISLPFALLEDEKAKKILKIVTEKLYTPVGLRSLPADHPDYVGIYGGSPLQRDSAYHQGTVWSWLLGPYIDSIIKTNNVEGLNHASEIINRFKYHLNEGGIGSVSEIFDGDAPHHPRGCIAQAWGVAELLRVIKEYKLY